MRASDADRDRVAEVLRKGAGEGRLEPDELEERLEAAYSATTLADLDALTRDLPRRPERGRDPGRQRSWSWVVASPLYLAAVITLAIVVHPVIWFALLPLLFTKHGGACHASGFHGRMRGHHPGTARL
jgi:hypothetical protein